MTRVIVTLLFTWLATASALSAELALMHAGRLLAIPGDSVRAEQTVVIRDGRIAAVRPGYVGADDVTGGADDRVAVYDLHEKFVLEAGASIT